MQPIKNDNELNAYCMDLADHGASVITGNFYDVHDMAYILAEVSPHASVAGYPESIIKNCEITTPKKTGCARITVIEELQLRISNFIFQNFDEQ